MQEEDEDLEMEEGANDPVLCRECLGQKRATLFCTPRCATRNLGRHRETKHGARPIQSVEAKELVTPLDQAIEKIMDEVNPGLDWSYLNRAKGGR